MCKIIRLSIEHLPSILEIERGSFTDAWSESMFLELLENNLAHGFIAEYNGGIAGYILFYLIPPELQILNVAVKKSARNQKIGSLLIKSALECENINLITLEVRESNTPAINLYKKFGFKTDGVRKNYYTQPKENAVLMSLEFTAGEQKQLSEKESRNAAYLDKIQRGIDQCAEGKGLLRDIIE